MDVFKDRFEMYNAQKIKNERERRFFNESLRMCEKKCLDFKKAQFVEKEKECFKNCSSKLLKDFLPIYETYV